MTYDFDYLIDKILDAEFCRAPFKHVYIEEFFSAEHFLELKQSVEISPPIASNDKELIDGLVEKGFRPISFPGCVTDVRQYINWHEGGKSAPHHSACEGFGMALRLYRFQSPVLEAINEFVTSDRFNRAIAKKFNVRFEDCLVDGGIQKYLDGYEISPHPDIRKKAATFMVNINPSDESENFNHHTHYLKLDDSHKYVQTFWEGNESVDRVWVPWGWAKTVKQQTKNNSIVLFSPSNDTLHGVKADYDHYKTQRTQLYGNLWFKINRTTSSAEWNALEILATDNDRSGEVENLRSRLVRRIPGPIKQILKGLTHDYDAGKRNV